MFSLDRMRAAAPGRPKQGPTLSEGRSPYSASGVRGFTLIELIVVMAIVALLVSIAAPKYFQHLDRARENTLKTSLNVMRDAIDQYLGDKGRYPDSLEDLAQSRYLREVPVDPLTSRRDSWVPVTPPPDGLFEGQMADVRSGAAGRASDGRLYADW